MLAAPLPAAARTRLAPSPTGRLHLGHVAHAAFCWGFARAAGGTVLLRLEDHDRGRWRPEYETALLDEVGWLGFVPDTPPLAAFRAGPTPYRQSDNAPAYLRALATLHARAHVYACDCSRREIVARMGKPAGEVRYDGHCRARGLPLDGPHGVRVALPDEAVAFTDVWLGPMSQRPADQCGDVLLRDRHGNWTYQFCVVVDDLEQGVDLVIRGQDLIDSTARQVLLARLLGRDTPPRFLHHPLVCDTAGRKLSKRDGDLALAAWRAAGHTPAAVIGAALQRCGVSPDGKPIAPAALAGWLRGALGVRVAPGQA